MMRDPAGFAGPCGEHLVVGLAGTDFVMAGDAPALSYVQLTDSRGLGRGVHQFGLSFADPVSANGKGSAVTNKDGSLALRAGADHLAMAAMSREDTVALLESARLRFPDETRRVVGVFTIGDELLYVEESSWGSPPGSPQNALTVAQGRPPALRSLDVATWSADASGARTIALADGRALFVPAASRAVAVVPDDVQRWQQEIAAGTRTYTSLTETQMYKLMRYSRGPSRPATLDGTALDAMETAAYQALGVTTPPPVEPARSALTLRDLIL